MKNRGFALHELLAVLLLMGLAFVASGELARDFSRYFRVESQAARRTSLARTVIAYLAEISEEAIEVSSRNGVLELEIWREPVGHYPALPLDPEAELPASWEPDSGQVTVKYELLEENLMKREGTRSSLIMSEVAGFELRQVDRILELSLSYKMQEKIFTVNRKIFRQLDRP